MWNNLSLQEKADIMKVAVRNGLTALPDIIAKYNEYASGGPLEKKYASGGDLKDIVLGAAIATDPAVAAASGWERTPSGTVTQDINRPGAEELRENLATISSAVDIVGPGGLIESLPGIANWIRKGRLVKSLINQGKQATKLLTKGSKANPIKLKPVTIKETDIKGIENSPSIGISSQPSLYKIETYPGYQLRGLLRGNPLEKQLSKTGTISVNNIRAQAAKGSNVEKAVTDKVLSSGQFVGKKSIDYNEFRKAVQDELITYNRVPNAEYEDYGIDRINLLEPAGIRQERTTFGHIDIPQRKTTANLNTFTFESPRIPKGADTHYDLSTLGHSRTFTTKEEPEILHVMESQSDWGQQPLTRPQFMYNVFDGNTNVVFDKNGAFHFVEKGKGIPNSEFMYRSPRNNQSLYRAAVNQFNAQFPLEQAKHLHDNYLQRQLQENLRYAAEQGQTKMRYPTRETAAKIEGYSPVDETKLTYAPEHETILKKYDTFPKQYKKLYKNADVRNVTDSRGNTWYEIDVPKDYLKQEWQFAKGGNLFAEGGPLEKELAFQSWRHSLPSNLQQDTPLYDLRRAYESGTTPVLTEDGYHLPSRDPKTGRLLKRVDHPTYNLAMLEDMRLGYYPNREGTATDTWEGQDYINNVLHRYAKGGSKLETRAKSFKDAGLKMYRRFIDAGIDPYLTIGILGNIGQESSFNPNATNGTHWGYVQNDKGIRADVIRVMGDYSPESQIGYLIKGMKGELKDKQSKGIQARFNRYINASKGIKDPAKLAANWDKYYEISGGQELVNRQYFANYFHNLVKDNIAAGEQWDRLVPTRTAPSPFPTTTFQGFSTNTAAPITAQAAQPQPVAKQLVVPTEVPQEAIKVANAAIGLHRKNSLQDLYNTLETMTNPVGKFVTASNPITRFKEAQNATYQRLTEGLLPTILQNTTWK